MSRIRKHQISFRLSDEEYDVLKSKITQSKMSQTDFFMCAISNQIITIIDDYVPLLAELKRQGSNLNQLTKYKNQFVSVTSEELFNALRECRIVYRELLKVGVSLRDRSV